MKPALKLYPLLAAAFAAFYTSLPGQITTLETHTQSGYFGSVVTFTDLAGSGGQKFTNISALTSFTYNFFAGTGNGNVSSATQLSAAFGEWNGSGLVAESVVNFANFTVAASNDASWSNNLSITNAAFRNFEYSFDFTSLSGPLIDSVYGYITDPTKTYAMILTDLTGGTNLGLGVNYSDPFAYGGAFASNGIDFVFSYINVVPGDQPVVVPEASTVAGILGATFVAGLVGFRVRQRRQLTTTATQTVPAVA